MRISDWSSDVCSSDLGPIIFIEGVIARSIHCLQLIEHICEPYSFVVIGAAFEEACTGDRMRFGTLMAGEDLIRHVIGGTGEVDEFLRSEEHTSELQSLMRISYAVFCLKKKKNNTINDI